MPGVVPRAQGRRSRPGDLGGVVAWAATEGGSFVVGQEVEVTVEDVAQGGWCVARPAGLPVMFVRHALPGERVVARVTEVTSKFARADAVEVLESSPDRVDAPCPHARPGGCGGCDWQHASLPAQRALKAAVITQQLRRLAGIDREVTVEPLPGPAPDDPAAAGPAPDGLGWRTRVQFAVDRDGIAGLRGHRSHAVIDVGDCLIAHQAVRDLAIPGDDWSGATAVEVAVGGADSTENFAVTVIEGGDKRKVKGQGPRERRRPSHQGQANPRRGAALPGRAGRGPPVAGRRRRDSGRCTPPPPTPSSPPWSRHWRRGRATRSSTCTAARACSPAPSRRSSDRTAP